MIRTRTVVVAGVLVVLLAAASTFAMASMRTRRYPADCGPRVTAHSTVQVMLTNMGGPMMGGGMMGQARGGLMRLVADRSSVPAGRVTFVATNNGSVAHEFVVLRLPGRQIVGTRPTQNDGKVDETGSVGEASKTCGAVSGDGIAPGASGWVTLNLSPDRYELVCNLPGHYAAGMYTQLTVT